MPENAPANVTEAPPPFAFQPPSGGDVDLKSCDDTLFRVHSVLLGLASTVFADMFAGATKADTVELAEDTESISLMLAFIYPVAPPPVNTLDLLEKFMIVAQKYNIDKMLKFVEQTVTSHQKLILTDPIRVFRISVQHNFPTVQALAARSLRPDQYDLTSVKGLLKLSKVFPNASHVIGLVGAQGARAKIIAGVLLRQSIQQSGVIWPKWTTLHGSRTSNYTHHMTCEACWQGSCNQLERWGQQHYRPGWFDAWAELYYNALLKKPLHQCDEFLTYSCFGRIRSSGLAFCESCIERTIGLGSASRRTMFEDWAKATKAVLEKELEALNALYSL